MTITHLKQWFATRQYWPKTTDYQQYMSNYSQSKLKFQPDEMAIFVYFWIDYC